ncbi:MAG: hypothetical protein IKU38_06395 [Clostridia bacterium]|nr:hypothetical protein [Clostridia bacterium]
MKKHIVALLMVLVLLVAVAPMQAMASSYPYITIDHTASTPTVEKGGNGEISLIIEASNKAEEQCVVSFRNSANDSVGKYTVPLANTPLKEREITVPIEAGSMNLAVGTYKARVWVESKNQSLDRWEALQTIVDFTFKVVSNKCGSSHTFEKDSVVSAPTCEVTGLEKHVCSVCGHIIYKETAKVDHNFAVKSWIVKPDHNYDRAGEALMYCTTCVLEPNEKIEVIPLSAVAKITSHPKDAAVSEGSTATFAVKATGSELTYQWYYSTDGGSTWKKSTCTKASYYQKSTPEVDGRQFYCVVTDKYGITATSDVATLSLPVAKITKQPKDTEVGYGEKAVVSIAATGDGLKYKWEFSMDGGATWSLSSCTATSYSQTMTVPMDGRMLRCTVTDRYSNSVVSDEVTLSIDRTELKITAQPKSVAVRSGEKATVSVMAVGDGLKYQWFYSADDGNTWQQSSCTSRSYSQTMSAAYDGRMLRCVVDDVYDDEQPETSNEVKLSVLRTELKFTTQPKSVTAAYGTKATFTVAATGDGVKYQWWYQDKDSSTWKMSSCTSKSYSQTLNATVDGRKLKCVVTDAYGDEMPSNEATMTVQRKELKITAQPKSVTAYEGEKVSVSVTATGDGLKYQWSFSKDDGVSWANSSCTSKTYSQTMSAAVDGRMLKCTVTDAYGDEVTSSAATLDTRFKAKITTQPKSVKVFDGEQAKVSISATGDGIKYEWWFSKDGGANWSKSSCTASSYSQTMTSATDGRKLYCIVKDKHGNSVKSNTVTLSLKKTVEITSQPKSQTKAKGEKATFTVKATGDGLKYEWWFSKDGGSSWSKSSCTSKSYSQTVSESVNGRKFYCIVSDAYGNSKTTSTATLTMK